MKATSGQYGLGAIHFDVDPQEVDYVVSSFKNKNLSLDPKLTDLDIVAMSEEQTENQFAQEEPNNFAHVVSSEKTTVGGRDAYKFTEETPFLGKPVTFHVYILIGEKDPSGKRHIYSIVTRYLEVGAYKNLVEQEVNNIKIIAPAKAESLSSSDTQKNSLGRDAASLGAQLNANIGASVADLSLNTSDTTSSASPEAIQNDAQLVASVKPSVVNILHIYCDTLTLRGIQGFQYLKPTYHFCDGVTGSGFILNKDGYIATNGHVVKTYPEQALAEGILSPPLAQFLQDYIKESVRIATGKQFTDADAQLAIHAIQQDPSKLNVVETSLYQIMSGGLLSASEDQSSYFVKLTNQPFVFDKEKVASGDFLHIVSPSPQVPNASVVGFDFPNYYSIKAVMNGETPKGSDVAILKVDNPQNFSFPALPLSNSLPAEGSPIVILGFPGLVSGEGEGGSLLDYKSSSIEPTISKGIVSSIKQDISGNTLIQTDASIDHGNSGGPAINERGEVIGIATYAIASNSGNYNFLRSIDQLKNLIDKNSVSSDRGQTYADWQAGLADFWGQHYTRAMQQFNAVKNLYPIHPSVSTFIADAQTGIQKGEDKDAMPIGLIILIIALTVGALISFFVIFQMRKKAGVMSETEKGMGNSTVTQELVEYIRQSLQQGVGQDVIKQTLMQNGWQIQDIDRAISLVRAPLPL